MTTSGASDQGKSPRGDLQARSVPIIKGLLTQIRQQQGWIQNYKEDLPPEAKSLMTEAEEYLRENRVIRPPSEVSGEEPEQTG